MNFSFLTGDVDWQIHGGSFISPKQNNGNFDYALVLNIINMHEATGEMDADKYNVSISAVAPSEVPKETQDRSLEDDSTPFNELSWEMQIELLSEYGVSSSLWTASGNNYKKLMKEARIEADTITMMFGFYMDRIQNGIGSNGWDFIKGDTLAGLNKEMA